MGLVNCACGGAPLKCKHRDVHQVMCGNTHCIKVVIGETEEDAAAMWNKSNAKPPTGVKRITLDLRPGGAQGAPVDLLPKSGFVFVIGDRGDFTGRAVSDRVRQYWDRVVWWAPFAEIERQVRE